MTEETIIWFIRKYKYEDGNIYNIKTNKPLGYLDLKNGYVRTYLKGKSYRVHRLVWLLAHGSFPKEIDHINRERSDNRIENLREVTRGENMKNKSKYKRNTSGVTGVTWHKKAKKWRAQININKEAIILGMFIKFSDAVNARKNAEVLYGFYK